MSGQEDFVLVPREPTEAMNEAGCIAAMECRIRESKALKAVVEKLGGAPAFMSQQGAEAWRAMLSAAPASPQPQGADYAGLYEAIKHGDEAHRAWLKEAIDNFATGKPIPPPHPRPSGNALSDETLWEMLAHEASLVGLGGTRHATARELDIFDRLMVAALKLARAVEARVRSTPTDEWRRAVEACARVLDQRSDNEVKAAQECRHQMILDDTQYIYCATELSKAAREIRALSPTKPDDGRL